MFVVLFEARPKPEKWDEYLGLAALLRPELERIDGFVDNIRYRSLRRPGLLLSLSTWRDEKALVRWRTHALHHEVQRKGRFEVFADYHLRVGEVTVDTHVPAGQALGERRLDATESGAAQAVSVVQAARPPDLADDAPAPMLATRLGLDRAAPGLVEWDVFDSILTPGETLLLASWRRAEEAGRHGPPPGARRRLARIVRDYGMAARHEAPQYFPNVVR